MIHYTTTYSCLVLSWPPLSLPADLLVIFLSAENSIEAEDWKSACVSGYHIMGSVLNWLRRDFIACCSSGRTFFCFSPRFFLFFFILGMTLSSQLSLYDKGINPFFQLDRVMWFEGWSEGWQQTWTTEIFWDWIEKKRSRLSSWHCGTWTISAAGFANSLAGWANCHIGKGRRSNRKYWWLISLSLR